MNAGAPSPWQSRSSARPLLAWRKEQLQGLASQLDAVVLAWAGDWGLRHDVPTVCENAARGAAPAGWQLLGRASAAAAWVLTDISAEAGLSRQLLGVEAASTPVAAEVVAACWGDLRVRLAAGLQIAPDHGARAGGPVVTEWGGAVEAGLGFGARMLVDGGCAAPLMTAAKRGTGALVASAARSELHALGEAIAKVRVPLKVHLRSCEIDVGSLQDLGLGDVVRLPHPLDSVAVVEDQQGQPLFGGQLARSQGCKAVELVPAPT